MNNSLTDLTVKGLLDVTAGKDPVPGGGSISALSGSIAAALTEMVAGLTIGKKKYAEVEEQMKELVERVQKIRQQLILDVDRDSEAYNVVFAAFQMPKELFGHLESGKDNVVSFAVTIYIEDQLLTDLLDTLDEFLHLLLDLGILLLANGEASDHLGESCSDGTTEC